jgi:diguanylate cyclase (GGDEF)-like protein
MREAIINRESDIQRLAYQDVLTELPNRTKFQQYLDELVQESRHKGYVFVVLMLDFDRFKEVNDTLGHESGDQILKIAGHRLSGLLRKSDIIARLGGDEFGILLPNSSSEQGLLLIGHIQDMFKEHVTLEQQPVDVGVSIGMALFPDHGDDANTLLRRADIAMYTAKRARSGHAIFDPEQDAYRREHLHLLGELRHAIEVDELMLVYQPKINVTDDRVVGVEALTRWNHPQRGIMLPCNFIPFAEHTGAIRLVTRWVIDKALRQCGMWQTSGIRLTVSFNVSVRDLLDNELPKILEVGLRQYGVPAGQVYLEITEGSLMEDPVKVRAVLDNLRKLGVQLAIDDYGTGYSSLAYLKDLPVSELKIDRAFITNIVTNPGDIAIVRSTIELGHNLGLSVVAEGVDDADQLAILQELGCDKAQGYYFGKPMSADVLEQWLSERHNPDRCGTESS